MACFWKVINLKKFHLFGARYGSLASRICVSQAVQKKDKVLQSVAIKRRIFGVHSSFVAVENLYGGGEQRRDSEEVICP